MALPEVFSVRAVARHLGVNEQSIRARATEIGACSEIGRHMLLTAADVEALLRSFRPGAQPPGVVDGQPKRSDRPFSTEELALEWGVSGQHIRDLVKTGKLPSFKVGRLIRISAKAAREFEATDLK